MPLTAHAALTKDTTFARQYKGPTMQHRHFSIVAAIIADLPMGNVCDAAIQAFTSGLRGTNPNFDQARFIRACCAKD